jgi:hypothetical protein
MNHDSILEMVDRALRIAQKALEEKDQRIVDLEYEKRQLEKALLERKP